MAQGTGWSLSDPYGWWLEWVDMVMGNYRPTRRPTTTTTGSSAFAPAVLTQPINPGWIFGNVSITNENSGDPETEREILQAASYGRQLGRILDAMAVLVARMDPEALTPERKALVPDQADAFDDFWALLVRIGEVKSKARTRALSEEGVAELAANLRQLRSTDRERYDRLKEILRSALDD